MKKLFSRKPLLDGMDQDKIREIYKQLFNTTSGKIVLADLEAKYDNRSTVVRCEDGSIDVNDVLVREGERRVLLRIKTLSRED